MYDIPWIPVCDKFIKERQRSQLRKIQLEEAEWLTGKGYLTYLTGKGYRICCKGEGKVGKTSWGLPPGDQHTLPPGYHWTLGGDTEIQHSFFAKRSNPSIRLEASLYTRLNHKLSIISEKEKELAGVKMELEEREDEAMACEAIADAKKKMEAFDSFTEAKKKFEAFEAEAMELPDSQLVQEVLMRSKLLQEIQDEVFKTCQGFAAAFCGSMNVQQHIERFTFSFCARMQALKELLEARLELAAEIAEAPVSDPQAPVSSNWTAAAPKKNSGAPKKNSGAPKKLLDGCGTEEC